MTNNLSTRRIFLTLAATAALAALATPAQAQSACDLDGVPQVSGSGASSLACGGIADGDNSISIGGWVSEEGEWGVQVGDGSSVFMFGGTAIGTGAVARDEQADPDTRLEARCQPGWCCRARQPRSDI